MPFSDRVVIIGAPVKAGEAEQADEADPVPVEAFLVHALRQAILGLARNSSVRASLGEDRRRRPGQRCCGDDSEQSPTTFSVHLQTLLSGAGCPLLREVDALPAGGAHMAPAAIPLCTISAQKSRGFS